MKKFELKYGCNPNQKPAHLDLLSVGDLPFESLNGRPGYINGNEIEECNKKGMVMAFTGMRLFHH